MLLEPSQWADTKRFKSGLGLIAVDVEGPDTGASLTPRWMTRSLWNPRGSSVHGQAQRDAARRSARRSARSGMATSFSSGFSETSMDEIPADDFVDKSLGGAGLPEEKLAHCLQVGIQHLGASAFSVLSLTVPGSAGPSTCSSGAVAFDVEGTHCRIAQFGAEQFQLVRESFGLDERDYYAALLLATTRRPARSEATPRSATCD